MRTTTSSVSAALAAAVWSAMSFTTAAVTANCTVIANFAIDTFTVTPSVTGNGAITPNTPQIVNSGATPNFTLTPNAGNHIVDVTGTCGGSLVGNVFTTAAVAANCSVSANFAPDVVGTCGTGFQVEAVATAGTPGPTGYTTLKGAFDAINVGTHQGAITVNVCADTTETASAALNASGTGGSSYTAITVNPAGGAARTVSGAIAAGSPLVDLVGASNVVIDGLNSGGNALTLSNTTASATAGTSTIRFIEGAQSNTVTRTTVLGSSTATVATAAGNILFSTSTVAGGNSGNMISNNDFGPAGANLPTKMISAVGTAANFNTNNTIDSNLIDDFFSPTVSVSGISVQAGNSGWTISNNRIYQRTEDVHHGRSALCGYNAQRLDYAGQLQRYRQHHRLRRRQRHGYDDNFRFDQHVPRNRYGHAQHHRADRDQRQLRFRNQSDHRRHGYHVVRAVRRHHARQLRRPVHGGGQSRR